MNKQFQTLRAIIRRFLKEELNTGYYMTKNNDLIKDPGHRYYSEDEPFEPNIKGLNIAQLKYFLDDAPPKIKMILNAPDTKIVDEPDLPEGIYAVYSKKLNQYFEVAYQSPHAKDYEIFLPNP